MTFPSTSEIQRLVGEAVANRPYSHEQRAEHDVTAVITVEEDLRYLPQTLGAVLAQSVLPSTIVVADCSGSTLQSVQTTFDIIPTVADPLVSMPESERITVQLVRVAHARSFGDAVAKALRGANVDTAAKTLWLLHDDSRPADNRCLEHLIDAWRNTPTASLLGAKQLDWSGERLHDVGSYAARMRTVSLVVDGEPDQEQYDGRSDVFAVSLAGALVPMNTLAAVGGFDAWFTTYRGSEDFCRRLCRAGRRVVVVPSARIAHRRARYEGLRTHDGAPLEPDEVTDPTMAVFCAGQKYAYTDVRAGWWPLMWLGGILLALGGAVRLLFRKMPYRAWCLLCMPWIALANIPGALGARHRLNALGPLRRATRAGLRADRRQIRQWNQRVAAFDDQRGHVVLDPLAAAHLRRRLVRRWVAVAVAALIAFAVIAVLYWPILRYAFGDTSLMSQQLLPTDASWRQLVRAATTQWDFGIGGGVPVPPTPWLLVLMVAAVFTGGHVAGALSLIFFLSAPACVLSFWALAGVVTRSDAIRTLSGLAWFALAMAMGLYSDANLPMLTVMVFLPAAFAFSFKAVGLYRTEQPDNPRSSVQAAAMAALLFIPVVCAEPQILLALVVIFVAFLVFVRRHRLMLLLIPFPAAFAVAPTLVNAVRYGADGMWRQLFGDILLPVASQNGSPEVMDLTTLAQRAFGMPTGDAATLPWPDGTVLDILLMAGVCVLVVLALLALLRPQVFRACRILWTVAVCGLLLAIVSGAIVVAVMPYGAAAGSVLPGVAVAACGLLACAALAAGSGVKPFNQLAVQERRGMSPGTVARGGVCVALAYLTLVCAACGWGTAERYGVDITGGALPMVSQDYLSQDDGRRVLAIAAHDANTVDYTVMRTGRGDLIDSSPAWRVSAAYGHEEGTTDRELARIAAQLLANSDNGAIEDLSALGFGGIYVVTRDTEGISAKASEQLLANVTSSQGTQSVVSNTEGTYYRLTIKAASGQRIDTAAQASVQRSPWRYAWLWCLGVIVALYCIVAIPRRTHLTKEDEQ
ncbi:MAG: glycosyl transferase family 2 [Bifidobacterium sp.]|nr:glycosyl transferase family 2 [Bifidobacterium sp.]